MVLCRVTVQQRPRALGKGWASASRGCDTEGTGLRDPASGARRTRGWEVWQGPREISSWMLLAWWDARAPLGRLLGRQVSIQTYYEVLRPLFEKKKCSLSYFLEVYNYPHAAFTSKAVGFPGVTVSHEGDKKRSHCALAKPPQAKTWQTDGLGCRRSSRASSAILVTSSARKRKRGGWRVHFKSKDGKAGSPGSLSISQGKSSNSAKLG